MLIHGVKAFDRLAIESPDHANPAGSPPERPTDFIHAPRPYEEMLHPADLVPCFTLVVVRSMIAVKTGRDPM